MKIADDIIDALNEKWRHLSMEGWDDDEAKEIIIKILKPLLDVMVRADSELSAIRHGRPPSSNKELEDLYYEIRKQYSASKR